MHVPPHLPHHLERSILNVTWYSRSTVEMLAYPHSSLFLTSLACHIPSNMSQRLFASTCRASISSQRDKTTKRQTQQNLQLLIMWIRVRAAENSKYIHTYYGDRPRRTGHRYSNKYHASGKQPARFDLRNKQTPWGGTRTRARPRYATY